MKTLANQTDKIGTRVRFTPFSKIPIGMSDGIIVAHGFSKALVRYQYSKKPRERWYRYENLIVSPSSDHP